MDAQIVEVLRRGHLIADLLHAGLEVAEPVAVRDLELLNG
jgi:hypothetical protein